MKLMAVDQSFTCTGVTIWDGDELVHFECIKTVHTCEDTGSVYSLYDRIATISNRLVHLFQEYHCERAVFEGLAYGGIGNASRNLAGLMFTIGVKLLEAVGYDKLEFISPTSLKKFGGGSGKANKKMMMDALPEDVYEMFYGAGYLRSKGLADLADSYWLAKYYQAAYSTQPDLLEKISVI